MSAAAPKSFSFLFLVPDDITPTIFRDGGQQACPLGNPLIGRIIVEIDTILQARLREIPDRPVFPLRRLPPALCSLGTSIETERPLRSLFGNLLVKYRSTTVFGIRSTR